MDAVIRPEPTPEERAAILAALEQAAEPAQRGAWWRLGIEESLAEHSAAAEL